MSEVDRSRGTVVLDLDGTLVDSNYAHVVAWRAAFCDVGVDVPTPSIHALVGMGGDRLVTAAASEAVEQALGDEVRARHAQHLDALFTTIGPTPGAAELLEVLREQGYEVVLASSSDRELTERLLDLVPGAQRLLETSVTGTEAERSKPSGELVERALQAVDADRAVVVGDSVWDVEAARDAGVPCIGLLTGGIAASTLQAAGAVEVLADPGELARRCRDRGGLVG